MRRTVLFAAAVITAAICVSPSKADISVTSVDIRGDMATVVINDVVEIREIEIAGNDIKFPEYVSSSGRVYPQVKFRTPAVRTRVAGAILNNRPDGERVRRISYDITDVSRYGAEGSSLAGFATVVFNNEMEIDVRIMEARYSDDYWISWPARPPNQDKGESGWQDLVIVTNRRAKNIIEDDIKDTFSKLDPAAASTEAEVEVTEGRVDDPLTVTNIEVEKISGQGDLIALADVDLNYAFRIKDIEVYERRGQVFLEFPRQITDAGQVYPQMQIFSRALRSEIRRAAVEGTPSADKYNQIGFEITKFEKNRFESALKYRGGVTINGSIEIDFSILDGDTYDAFVSWPSVREEGQYVDKIFPINRDVQRAIETAILERYRREQ